MRDDFSEYDKRIVAARVAYRCSNPGCNKQTSGPQVDPTKALNVGVAAHITAASLGGPRYDPSLTAEERRSITNAIWLCQTCAKLVDNDPIRFSVDVLCGWKEKAEAAALDQLEKAGEADGLSAFSTSQIWNVPHPPNRFFTGRQQELNQIREALVLGGTSAVTQPQAISGLGGIGKTQTVVEYAYRWHKEYKAVLWTKADSRESLMSGFAAISRVLLLPEMDSEEQTKIVESVLRWLQENSNWLLIFDNADHPKLIEDFIPAKHRGHILLTSRAKVLDSLHVLTPITLGNMLPDEAEELLQKRTGRDELDIEEVEAMAQLAKNLDYFPLALEQAGAYINKTMCSFKNYLKCYFEHGLTLLEKSGAVVGKYPNSVTTTWLLNFEQVEQISKASSDLLRASAFLNPDSIPVEILIAGAEELGSSISVALSEIDSYPLALDELMAPVADYSLISREASERTYNIHRLVQAVLRQQMDDVEERLWAERVVRAVNQSLPSNDFLSWSEFERFLPQAQACAEHIERFGLEFEDAVLLLLQTGKYLSQRYRLSEAESYFQRALTVSGQSGTSEHTDRTAESLNSVASIYYHLGNYKEAEAVLLRALEVFKKRPEVSKFTAVNCLNNLGELYRAIGKYSKAEEYYKQAIPILEAIMTIGDHRAVLLGAGGLNNLAELYRAIRKDDEAEMLYKKAIKSIEVASVTSHPILGMILNNLGELYRQQRKYSKAEPLYKRSIQIQEGIVEEERNYELGTVLNNLGLTYYFQGKYDDAEPLIIRALAIEKEARGGVHPRYAQSLNNLALIRCGRGDYQDAIPLFKQALEIWQEALGYNHPDIARGLNNLGRTYRILQDYEVAESLYKRALTIMEKAFGRKHREVMESLINLWEVYFVRQRYEEANLYFDRLFTVLTDGAHVAPASAARNVLAYAKEVSKRGQALEAAIWESFAKELKRKGSYSHEKILGEVTVKTKKAGRNEPCPCGSNKKFKRCCGA